jgi:hypothetical protein
MSRLTSNLWKLWIVSVRLSGAIVQSLRRTTRTLLYPPVHSINCRCDSAGDKPVHAPYGGDPAASVEPLPDTRSGS